MNKDKKLGYGDLVLKKCVINGCKVHQLSNFDDHMIKNIKKLTIYKCEIQKGRAMGPLYIKYMTL